ncbi:MAG: DnaD domain protein [Bacilli bacterium]|nr:DnaD domain protein [Bacilli bacterium]
MVTEAIDFRYLVLDHYKSLKITEEEVTTIFMIDFLISQGNPFITADLLSLKMSLSVKEIDNILANLLKKGLIEYVSQGKKTVTTLNPLKKKLYREFQLSFAKEQTIEKSKDFKESLDNIYSQFEKLLNRPLSPVEISKIREWVSYGYEDDIIIGALKEALSKGKKTLRSVDKILLQWATRDDIEKEGHSPINEEWDKDLAETIRIAKTPWVDDD